ncbi:MAG: HAMP domain-containing histidine kinase [Clostridia bacterium]|nr:HAMP domain-containing histidine kinase [Clostridia bacterium]
MIKKLRHKFIAISVLSVFLVLLVIMGVINILNYSRVARDSDAVLNVLAENNGEFPKWNSFKRGNRSRDWLFDELSPELSPELAYESRYFTVRLSCEGNVTSVDTGRIAAVDTDTAKEYAEKLWESSRTSGFVSNYRYLKKDDGGDTVILFLDCRSRISSFRSFLLYSIFVSLGGMVAVAVLVLLLSKMVMKPVQESYEKQKSFITDAGHEIKTPLTIIDADATILEMDCGEDNEWIRDIRAQVSRLTSLTKDLIYLSRMEEEKPRMQYIDFPLSDVITETAQSFQSLAKVQEKTFTVEVEPMLSICGDEKAITQLVSILLDNALKYSDERGRISLKAYSKGRNVCIEVYNTAEHVDTTGLGRLFDRFYRADKSRNSQTGGYGIGLSIAKAVAEAHKGRIAASSADGKSLTVTAVLGR